MLKTIVACITLLSLTSTLKSQLPPFSNVIELKCGDLLPNSLANANLSPKISCDGSFSADSVLSQWYQFTGDGGLYEIDFLSQLDIFVDVYVKTPDSINCYHEKYLNLNVFPLLIQSTELTQYLIRIRPKYSTGDIYLLSFSCFPTVSNFTCSMAQDLNCADSIQFNDLRVPVDTANIEFCRYSDHPGFWYKVPNTSSRYRVSRSLSVSNVIELWEGDCDNIKCLDEGPSITVQPNGTNDFFIRIPNTRNHNNIAKIKSDCSNPLSNVICANAIKLTAQDTIIADITNLPYITQEIDNCRSQDNYIQEGLWYAIDGNNKIHTFKSLSGNYSIFILEYDANLNPCSDAKCIKIAEGSSPTSFFATIEKTYLIFVHNDRYQSKSALHFTIDETDRAANIQCLNSQEIMCSDTLDLNFGLGLNNNSNQASLWYKYVGDENYISLNLTRNVSKLSVYKSNCNQEELIAEDINTNMLNFQSEENIEYYIKIE